MVVSISTDVAKNIGKLLWNAYKNRKEENKKLDFFVALVQLRRLPALEFVNMTLDKFIPYAIRKKNDIIKIRRKMAKFCFYLPESIINSGYTEFFPILYDVKNELLNKLEEYGKLNLVKLEEKFSDEIEEVENSVVYNDKKSLGDIEVDIKQDFLNDPNIFDFITDDVKDRNMFKDVVFILKNNYYEEAGLKIDEKLIDHRYIDHEISGMIGDYYLEKKGIKGNLRFFDWD